METIENVLVAAVKRLDDLEAALTELGLTEWKPERDFVHAAYRAIRKADQERTKRLD